MTRKLTTKILQAYANFLIGRLEKSKSSEEFDFWYQQAIALDIYCLQREIKLE